LFLKENFKGQDKDNLFVYTKKTTHVLENSVFKNKTKNILLPRYETETGTGTGTF
jgi:hypothetical protein